MSWRPVGLPGHWLIKLQGQQQPAPKLKRPGGLDQTKTGKVKIKSTSACSQSAVQRAYATPLEAR